MLERDLLIGVVSVRTVCLSFCHWLKTNDRRITRFSLSGSTGTLTLLIPTVIP